MATLRFRVSEADEGARLDRVLATQPDVGSRALAQRLISEGVVSVAGAQAPKSRRVAAGESIEVELPESMTLVPEELDVTVVWEDAHLLVVDKPAGIVVHPAGGHTTGTLVHGLLARGIAGGDEDRPGVVHRLDRDTSGLMLVARSDAAHRKLQAAVRRREVERGYLALARGRPRSRTGRIAAAIGRDRHDRARISLDTDRPREAVTWFEVRELLRSHTLLDVRLETGRTHQIRVHLEAIGLPVAGDPVYGVAGDLGLGRQFLHAHRLRLLHPFGDGEIDVSSPLPVDLEAALGWARSL